MPKVAIVDLHGNASNTAIPALSAHVVAAQCEFEIYDGVHGRLPRAKKYDAYLVSGGPLSPNAQQPWRVRLQAATPEWIRSRPVFAIGLGFEVMAAAHGWAVRTMSEPRQGVYPLTPTPAGWTDPVMVDLEQATPVFEQRTWAVLPPPAATRSKSVVLAYTSAGDVGVARFGPNAVGTIFHPEVKTDGTATTVLARFLMDALSNT